MEPTPTSAQDAAARRLALVLGAGGDGLRCVRFDAPWGRGGTTVLDQLVEAAGRPLVSVPPDLRADATGDGAGSPEAWIEGVLTRTDSPVVVVDPVGDLEFTRAGAVADLVRRAADRDASVSVVLVDDGRPLTPMVGRALDLVEGAIAEHAPALLAALDASSDADVARVVRDAWPTAHDALVAAAVEAAGGAPGIALRFVEQELGRTATATDRREGFAGWMDRLEPPTALLTAVLARVPGAVPTWACARLEDVGEAAVNALAATLMATERDGWIELDPGARRHAAGVVPVTLARAGVRELAEVLAEAADAADAPEPRLLAAAATVAGAAGDAPTAIALLDRLAAVHARAGEHRAAYGAITAAASQAVDPTTRGALLVHAAVLARQASLVDVAGRALQELDRVAEATSDPELAAFVLHELHYYDLTPGRMHRLRAAAAIDPEAVGWSARARAACAFEELDPAGAAHHDEVAARVARDRGDHALLALALRMRGLALELCGRAAEALDVLDEAADVAGRHSLVRWQVAALDVRASAFESLARSPEALAPIDDALEFAQGARLTVLLPDLLARRAMVQLGLGRLDDAAESVASALRALGADSSPIDRFQADAAAAYVAVDRGDVVEARAAITRFAEMSAAAGNAQAEWELQLVRARLHLLEGDIAGAVAAVPPPPMDDPTVRCIAATFLARTAAGDPIGPGRDYAMARAATLLDVGPDPAPLVVLASAEVAAIAARDAHALAAAAAGWASAGRQLDAARARVARADVMAAGAPGGEPEDLQAVHATFRSLGALHDADALAVRLRHAGVRVLARRTPARDDRYAPLSERDLQICMLVAEGLRNREVAEQLGLQTSSVSRRLARIYPRLGVGSRTELSAWLAARAAAP